MVKKPSRPSFWTLVLQDDPTSRHRLSVMKLTSAYHEPPGQDIAIARLHQGTSPVGVGDIIRTSSLLPGALEVDYRSSLGEV